MHRGRDGGGLCRAGCGVRHDPRQAILMAEFPLSRKYAKKVGMHIEVLGDSQGPQLRVENLQEIRCVYRKVRLWRWGSAQTGYTIKPRRITVKSTTRQNALPKAAGPWMVLLIEDGLMKVTMVE